jgi:hypothetical protein
MSLQALFAVIQCRKYNRALSKIQTFLWAKLLDDPRWCMPYTTWILLSARHVCERFKLNIQLSLNFIFNKIVDQGCTVHRCLVAWVTNFCMVAPDILSVITAVFLAHEQKCISVHVHQVESVRYQWGSQVIQELWVFVELGSCRT